MRLTISVVAILFSMSLSAQELPIESHVIVCGDGSVAMNDEELSEMLACTLEQRDAMGYLMDRWQSYPAELREACVARLQAEEAVDYVQLAACIENA